MIKKECLEFMSWKSQGGKKKVAWDWDHWALLEAKVTSMKRRGWRRKMQKWPVLKQEQLQLRIPTTGWRTVRNDKEEKLSWYWKGEQKRTFPRTNKKIRYKYEPAHKLKFIMNVDVFMVCKAMSIAGQLAWIFHKLSCCLCQFMVVY